MKYPREAERCVDRTLLRPHREVLGLLLFLWLGMMSVVAGDAFRSFYPPERTRSLRRTVNPYVGYRSPPRVRHSFRYAKYRMLANVPSAATKAPQRSELYADLSLFGKAVAGCVEILTSVAFDYCMGYASGYFLGTVLGVPRVMFFGEKTSSTGDMWRNLMDRTKLVHSKSHSYGRSWGNVSAVFGGSRTAVGVVRGTNKKDDWNEIFSSVLAGALMSRSGGPQAMLRSAVIYGGLMYLLSSGSKRRTPFTTYEEQLVDF